MNIVLVHPYIKVRVVETYLSEPLGLLCLASHLDAVFNDNVNVAILDLYALGAMNPKKEGDSYCLGINDPDFIANELERLKPDLIGIHCNFTAYAEDSLEVASIVKQCMPEVPIVIGGAHPTIEGDSILKDYKCIDYVAKGEGEIILEHLVRALKGEMNISNVNGLSYRKDIGAELVSNDLIAGGDDDIIVNNPMALIKDLDSLPIPNRNYIDMDKYSYFNKQTIWYVRKKSIATIMTSRGCPYDCVFCSTKVVWTRKWRHRSLENVFTEIQMLYDDYGIREFVINDDQFMTRKKRIHAFCDYFIEKNLDIYFSVDAGISIWLVEKELLTKMKKAGFYSLRFPIETGSKKTLEYVGKPVDLEKAKDLIDTANQLGFWTSSNIIVGFPYETREDILESIQYAYDSSLDFTSFLIAHPNAGAKMYDDFQKEGLMGRQVVRGSDFYSCDYDTVNLKAKEISDMVREASENWFAHKFKFYLKPRNFYNFFLPKIKNMGDFRYLVMIFFTLVNRKIKPVIVSKLSQRMPGLKGK